MIGTSPLVAQDENAEEEGWTPSVSMQFRTVNGMALSPDGSLVAYLLREPLMEGESSEYLSHLWVVSTNGGPSRQFTRGT